MAVSLHETRLAKSENKIFVLYYGWISFSLIWVCTTVLKPQAEKIQLEETKPKPVLEKKLICEILDFEEPQT